MVPEQCLFMLRLICYCIIWMLSFIIFAPLGVVLDDHQGYCLLYADSADYGPVAVCGYTITVPIIFSTFYGGYMAVAYFCKISIYNRLGFISETLMEFLVTVVMDGLSWIFMFVNASLISAGFNDMCWNIFGTIDKCSDGVLKHEVFGTDSKFFMHIKIAEVAAWLSWLLWLLQLLMGLTALWRSGVLPEGEEATTCFGACPCRPQCTCTCRLHFQKPDNNTGRSAPRIATKRV